MKHLLLLLTITLTLSCCNNDDNTPTNPIDQLPPATQTGANTAGALVNGEVFYLITKVCNHWCVITLTKKILLLEYLKK